VEVAATIAALEAMKARVEAATPIATAQGGAVIVRNAQERAPVGPPAPGTLLRSIVADPVIQTGDETWMVRAAPHVVYGRIRELGGIITPVEKKVLAWVTSGTRPATIADWKQAKKDGRARFAYIVVQEGTHYLQRGLDASEGQILDIATAAWGTAILGG
jgi:hypothetical protein